MAPVDHAIEGERRRWIGRKPDASTTSSWTSMGRCDVHDTLALPNHTHSIQSVSQSWWIFVAYPIGGWSGLDQSLV